MQARGQRAVRRWLHAVAPAAPVRVRYAPSPTGALHLGGLRTALFNYLFAKANNGTFILRIEDTDKSRQVPGSIAALIRALEWCGLHYDEGPVMAIDQRGQNALGGGGAKEDEAALFASKGAHGPYVQSQRLPIYTQHAATLLASGRAYRCFCSAERLQAVRDAQAKAGVAAPIYDRECLRLPQAEAYQRAAAGEPHVVRLLVPPGASQLHDCVLGLVSFAHAGVDDQVLLKSDGFPTYHLASVVDDHAMAISHVIRGQEWLSSTPKHLILYRALGWTPPAFAHLPLLLNGDRTKLSKRKGDASVEDYTGYLPEALVNFVALLGWAPPVAVAAPAASTAAPGATAAPVKEAAASAAAEVLSMDALVAAFSLERVNRANAVVDRARLDFFNAQHIRALMGDGFAVAAPGALRPKDGEFPLLVPDTTGRARVRAAVVPLVQRALQALLLSRGVAAAESAARVLPSRLSDAAWNARLMVHHERVSVWADFVELLLPLVLAASPADATAPGGSCEFEAWMTRDSPERHAAVCRVAAAISGAGAAGKKAKGAATIGLPAAGTEGAAAAAAPLPSPAESEAALALFVRTQGQAPLTQMVAGWQALPPASSPAGEASSGAGTSGFCDHGAAFAVAAAARKASGVPGSAIFAVLRYLLTGMDVGASLSDTMRLLGREECCARVHAGLRRAALPVAAR